MRLRRTAGRNYHQTPLNDLTKSELIQLIGDMRIRHYDERAQLLALIPDEKAIDLLLAQAKEIA